MLLLRTLFNVISMGKISALLRRTLFNLILIGKTITSFSYTFFNLTLMDIKWRCFNIYFQCSFDGWKIVTLPSLLFFFLKSKARGLFNIPFDKFFIYYNCLDVFFTFFYLFILLFWRSTFQSNFVPVWMYLGIRQCSRTLTLVGILSDLPAFIRAFSWYFWNIPPEKAYNFRNLQAYENISGDFLLLLALKTVFCKNFLSNFQVSIYVEV